MADYSTIGGGDLLDGPEKGTTEEDALSLYHEEFNKATLRIEKQRFWMRWLAFSIALAAALSAAYLEYLVLTYIMNPCTKSGDSLLALSIAPVASITLIVIFMLLGAFQGFKDKDLKTIPGETLLSKSTGE